MDEHGPQARRGYINRIVIDPRNTDVVFVAATGSLFGPGGERGVYKTTDGGKTWKQVLKVDDDTGANDLVMDPTNNQVLYAATYQRRRTACCMNGGGPGSGIWKSTDGGDTWTRLKGGGLPEGPLGRIGLDVYRKRPNILYALDRRAGAGKAAAAAAPPPQARRRRKRAAAAAPAGGPRRQHDDRRESQTWYRGCTRSDDAGATWRKVNDENPRPMYFSQVRIDPNDPEVVYYGGVGLHQSSTAARTSTSTSPKRRTTTCTRSGSIRRTQTTSSSATTEVWP